MSYSVRAVLIVGVVGIISFFVAQAVIPDRNAVTEKDLIAAEQAHRERAAAPVRAVEEIPVVTVDKAAAKAVAAAPVPTTPPPTPASVSTQKPPAQVSTTPTVPIPAPAPAPASAQKPVAKPDTVAKKAQVSTAPVPVSTPTQKPDVKPDTAAKKAQASTPPPAPAVSTPVSTPAPAPAVSTPVSTPPPTGLKIESSKVCSAIENKVPVGAAEKFSKDSKHLYYFTHVSGARDTAATVIHRWYHEGKLVQTSSLQIKSSNWRTHSRRNLTGVPDITGNWKVEVVEPKTGKVMEASSFVIE